jgi:hypothetical protein
MDFLNIICNVILSVIFASSFICIFFFTYAKNVERQVVLDNLKYIISSLLSTPIAILKSLSLYDISKLSQFHPNEEDLLEDKKVVDSNNELIMKSITYIGGMLVCGLIIVLGLSIYKKRDEDLKSGFMYFFTLILINLFMVSGIGLTEFAFLNLIGANFKAADDNVIIKQVLINLNNSLHKSN